MSSMPVTSPNLKSSPSIRREETIATTGEISGVGFGIVFVREDSWHASHMACLIQFRQLGLQLLQNCRDSLFSLEHGFIAATCVDGGEAGCYGPNNDIRAGLFKTIDGLPENGKGLPHDVSDPCRFSVLGAV